jgi:hypothetical protein
LQAIDEMIKIAQKEKVLEILDFIDQQIFDIKDIMQKNKDNNLIIQTGAMKRLAYYEIKKKFAIIR